MQRPKEISLAIGMDVVQSSILTINDSGNMGISHAVLVRT